MNLVRPGTEQPQRSECSAEDKARHFFLYLSILLILRNLNLATTIIDRVTSEQKYKANGDWQSLRLALTNLKESQRSIPAWSQAVMSVHHAAALLFEYSVQTGFPSSVKSYNETLNFKDLLIDNVPTTFVFCVFRQDLINRLVVA